MNIQIYKANTNTPFEITEIKGIGHPDTLCDGTAEYVSQKYSQYCFNKFGYFLNHKCDKFAIVGGRAKVGFGFGKIIKPFKFIMNGCFSKQFGNKKIRYKKLIRKWIREYIGSILTTIDPERDMEIIDMIHPDPSPGIVYRKDGKLSKLSPLSPRSRIFQFSPRNQKDLTQDSFLTSNDTSAGFGYAPYSLSDLIALDIENKLNSSTFRESHPYIGSDIKTMVVVYGKNVEITTCIPFIGKYAPNIKFYKEKIVWLKKIIKQTVRLRTKNNYSIKITINNRDIIKQNEIYIYLTATGSSVESGDEGVVGRGNRVNGVIPISNSISMEAACGKNPIRHVGKLYNVVATQIALAIYNLYKTPCRVYLVSQTGRSLQDPWQCHIILNPKGASYKVGEIEIKNLVKKYLKNINNLSKDLIFGRSKIY
jgi:S-adenosylmethionine synthetase